MQLNFVDENICLLELSIYSTCVICGSLKYAAVTAEIGKHITMHILVNQQLTLQITQRPNCPTNKMFIKKLQN